MYPPRETHRLERSSAVTGIVTQEETHMAERALRGSRLGAQSYETDAGIEMAPRQSVTYDCAHGHRFAMPFSLEADVPEVWECTVCGSEALRMDGTRPEPKAGKPARTHWDMLLERRSVKELEVLLAERLEQLRAGARPSKTRSTVARNQRKTA
jgi:rubredoxin